MKILFWKEKNVFFDLSKDLGHQSYQDNKEKNEIECKVNN